MCLVFNLPKFSHVTPLLCDPHWLPVAVRIWFNMMVLAFKAISRTAPIQHQTMVRPHAQAQALHYSWPAAIAESEVTTLLCSGASVVEWISDQCQGSRNLNVSVNVISFNIYIFFRVIADENVVSWNSHYRLPLTICVDVCGDNISNWQHTVQPYTRFSLLSMGKAFLYIDWFTVIGFSKCCSELFLFIGQHL